MEDELDRRQMTRREWEALLKEKDGEIERLKGWQASYETKARTWEEMYDIRYKEIAALKQKVKDLEKETVAYCPFSTKVNMEMEHEGTGGKINFTCPLHEIITDLQATLDKIRELGFRVATLANVYGSANQEEAHKALQALKQACTEESRSIQRRVATQKGEPVPEFDGESKIYTALTPDEIAGYLKKHDDKKKVCPDCNGTKIDKLTWQKDYGVVKCMTCR